MSTDNNLEKNNPNTTNCQNASITELFMLNPVELILSAARQIQPMVERQSKQIESLQSENTNLRIGNIEKITHLEIENKDLKEKLGLKDSELTDANQKISELTKANGLLDDSIETLKKQLNEEMDLLTQKSEEIENHKNQITQLSQTVEGSQKTINDLWSNNIAVLTNIVNQLNSVVEEATQDVEGKWKEYISAIRVDLPENADKYPETIKRMIVAERSVLCRLASIRWWSMQSELFQRMKEMFNVDLLVCITDLLIEVVKPFGYTMVVPQGPLDTNLSSIGYKSYDGAFSIVGDLFPNCDLFAGKMLYSEVVKLSYSSNDSEIQGEIAYSQK